MFFRKSISLPLLLLLAFVLAALLSQKIESLKEFTVADELPKATYCHRDLANCEEKIEPGLKVRFNQDYGSWEWQYGRELENGCQKLLFSDSPVSLSAEEIITIELKIYQSDDQCSTPGYLSAVRGKIAASEEASFQVLVDGKKVGR